jgi:hypothetical protein
MPIAGFTRFRKHQVGPQTSLASNSVATRILPYRGAIVYDPQRTDPDVDVGSLDPILAPFAGAAEVSGNWEGKLAFDDAPYIWNGTIKGGVTPTGATAKAWVWQAASLTADTFGLVTDQWGDDYSTDVIVGGGGTIDSLEIGFGDDLSAFDVNADLIYARAQLCQGFTGGLTIDSTPNWVYGADTEVFLDTTFGAIGTTKLTDTIHGATLNISNNLDQKRFANGSNSRFELAGYGRGAREITVTLVLAKTTQSVAEACTLDDTPVPNRFIELRTTSPEIITGVIPYSQSIRVPARLISRADGEIGGNTTITLVYRGYYDSDLGYAIRAAVVNTLTAL